MPAKKTPSGKSRVGEQKNQSIMLQGVVTFTGSTIVDLQRAVFKRAKRLDAIIDYQVMALNFEDAGGAALVHRLASLKNADNTFTIAASKSTAAAGVYAAATNPCTVRWTVLVTS